MIRSFRTIPFLALLVWASFGMAQEDAAVDIVGFKVPEYDSQNRMKSCLFGEQASFLQDGWIDITGLRIEFYETTENPDEHPLSAKVEAKSCLYNQDTERARSDSEMRIGMEKMIVTGKGFRWSAAESRFELDKSVQVVLKDAAISLTGKDSK